MENNFEQLDNERDNKEVEKNSIENQDENQEKKEFIDNYLTAVGLDWEDLEDKKVLEIGAGLGSFAQEAKKRNIDVTSLEKNPELWEDEGMPDQETPYVKGDASNPPFKNESFDYVISRAAPPIISPDKEEVKNILGEVGRVLKPGGEFHFGPANLNSNIFSEEELNKEVDGIFQNLKTEDRVEVIKNKAIKFLKSINPSIEYQEKEDPKSGEKIGFYVLKKDLDREKEFEVDEKEKYYNEDYIEKVLVEGNQGEMEKLKEIHNLSSEQINLFSDFAKLRRKTLDKMKKEIISRQESDSKPTKEELSMGAFIEQIEPQVREAVLNLRNKGYNTYESGFGNFDSQIISFNNDCLKDFEFSQEVKEKLKERGVKIIIKSNSIELKFKEFKDLQEIKDIWNEIIKDLPNLDNEVELNDISAAKNFREKWQED